jgi:hypothetical protein
VLAEGETPSASESADALLALNQMLDSWSTERLAVYTTTDQVFTWPAGQASRTLGPGGDFVGTRPVVLDDSTYFVVNGVSFPIQIVSQQQYNAIAVKGITSTFPQLLYASADYPDTTLTLYPVPTQALEFHFVSALPIAQPVDLTTVLSCPPGYLRAFTYCLAMEIAPEFGVEPPNQVKRVAVSSKRDIKRINDPGDLMTMPGAILGTGGGFNVYTGGFQ